MRRLVLAQVSAVILFTALAGAQEFVEVKSPNFTVITDAGEAQAHEIGEHFEQVRSAFGIFFNKQSLSVPLPLTTPTESPTTETTANDRVVECPLVVIVLFAQRRLTSLVSVSTTTHPSAPEASSAASVSSSAVITGRPPLGR